MQSLILFIGENEKFEITKMRKIFEQIPGVKKVREDSSDDASLECHFSDDDRSTIIILHKNLEIISISGTGDESLKAALEIQKRYPKSIRLIDSSYSFDIAIEKIISVSKLREMMLKSSA